MRNIRSINAKGGRQQALGSKQQAMRIIERIREMQSWSERERCARKRLVLVPTIGSLLEGHLSLVREGRERGDLLVVSLLVSVQTA